ncbi:MAG: methionine biosynthesis protein MetW [Gammaproteobacteria bacterium]|nr:methionine biosynthesis protein MetW [Gammaproteobacteria bacterium]PCH62320.1 MAG: methionine biosynthesis protein MetW [Gammaproteobacteria bacterium]PCH64774.1 MAG: methionine biosynthesis protein MetW [Gammaproteobacteria bacterium]
MLRPDLEIISDWINANSRVLDLGCGDGTLLAHLIEHRHVSGYGLEIQDDNITKCLDKGLNVLQINLDEGLADFNNNAFDYVVMTQTLQAVSYPDKLLEEMLRVGREVIVTFPNFGHWRSRMNIALQGRMPLSDSLPHAWYNTPNIRLCTLHDFEALCAEKSILITERTVVNHAHRTTIGMRWLPNFFGEIALYRLRGAAVT